MSSAMQSYLGSCGETSERTAARIHSWAALAMALCAVAELAALGLHVVMMLWHAGSVSTHEQRARLRGE